MLAATAPATLGQLKLEDAVVQVVERSSVQPSSGARENSEAGFKVYRPYVLCLVLEACGRLGSVRRGYI